MESLLFKSFINDIHELNTSQFRKLRQCVKDIEHIDVVSLNLETKSEMIMCPHCGNSEKLLWGKRSSLQRYKCKRCGRTYNSLTGTPLARLRKKTKWLDYGECLKNGLSVRQAAVKCKVHRNTSFKWRHRFLSNAKNILPSSLNGIVEAYETYFRKSEKGCKRLNRSSHKRGYKNSHNKFSREHVCVLFCRDRNSNTLDKVVESFKSKYLGYTLATVISPDVLFCSDEKSVYKDFTNSHHIRHGCLNISAGQKVVKEIVHIKNVDLYQKRLREWIYRFHGVATKYLENYLSWFRELDEFNMETTKGTFLLRAKQRGQYKVQPLFVT